MTNNTPDYEDNLYFACNKISLTEQWKKGELPSGYYYVKNEFGNIFPSDYSEDYDCINDTVIKDFFTEVSEIKEVLEPVPSYEKYISLVNWKEDLTELCTVKERIIEKYENIDTWWKAEYDELKKENAQLKELLKECQKMIAFKHEVYEEDALIKEIDEVLK